MKVLTLRTLALGVALGAVGFGAMAVAAREADTESAIAANDKRQTVGETKTQRAGRFSYVTTTFPIPAGSTVGVRGDAFCPRGSQLTGGFGSGSTISVGDNVTLAAVLVRADGKDRGNVADNGLRAFIENPTSMEAEGRVEAICQRGKKRKR